MIRKALFNICNLFNIPGSANQSDKFLVKGYPLALMYAELAKQQALDDNDPLLDTDNLMQFSSERGLDQFKEAASTWVGLLDIVQSENRKVGDFMLAKESDEDDVRVNEAYTKILEKQENFNLQVVAGQEEIERDKRNLNYLQELKDDQNIM